MAGEPTQRLVHRLRNIIVAGNKIKAEFQKPVPVWLVDGRF